MLEDVDLSEPQRLLIDILKDGLFHKPKELHALCCGPSTRAALHLLINRTKKKISPHGYTIYCVYTGDGPRYQLYRQHQSPYV